MRFPFHPSRRSVTCTAVVAALGLSLVGGMSTAAYAADDSISQTAAATATTAAATYAPYRSSAAADASDPIDEIVASAESARDDAETALAEAEAAERTVAGSGLEVEGSTTIDTSALEGHLDDFATIDVTPVLLLPASTEDAASDTAAVMTKTDELLDRLQDAKDKKAAEEAAKKKAAEEAAKKKAAEEAAAKKAAEEAAAAAAAEEASSSSSSSSSGSSSSSSSSSGSGDNSVAGAKATAKAMVADRGWGSDQYSCLVSLWNKESGWNYQAYNSGSGAYGIPQALPGSKMASAGSDWKTSAATQIAWGLNYIAGRYSTPCGAWSHSQSTGWY